MHEGRVVAACIAAIFNVIVCFGIPLGAIAYYLVRDRARAAVFGLGVLSFFVSQVVLRSAMLNALNGTVEFAVFSATRPLLHMLFLALTAAVFEETARLLFLRPQRKNTFDVGVAVAFGMGHGGCEAMIVGLNSAALLIRAAPSDTHRRVHRDGRSRARIHPDDSRSAFRFGVCGNHATERMAVYHRAGASYSGRCARVRSSLSAHIRMGV